MANKQDEPDGKVISVEEEVEMVRAFRRIESAQLRRKLLRLAKLLARRR